MARPKKRPIDPLEGTLPNAQTDIDSKPKSPDINLDFLLSSAILLVEGDLSCIQMAAARGKLDPDLSKDLVAYTKLIYDLKSDTADALNQYSDEELITLANQ